MGTNFQPKVGDRVTTNIAVESRQSKEQGFGRASGLPNMPRRYFTPGMVGTVIHANVVSVWRAGVEFCNVEFVTEDGHTDIASLITKHPKNIVDVAHVQE